MKQQIIKLEAELDLEKNETRVKSIDEDYWVDFGYWLEVTGFMAYQAMKYREWNEEKMIKHIEEYITRCLRDYKIKRITK